MQFVTLPNLPSGKVIVAVSGVSIEGVKTIVPPPVACLPPAMQQHADLQICHLWEKVLVSAPEVHAYYKEKLSPFGFEILCGETYIGSTYPKDAAYNIARVGNVAFLNPKTADPTVVRLLSNRGIRIISVRQGYTKCSILPVGEDALITADKGIASAAKLIGFSVREIEPGGVKLDGFSYGFLGGATGKIDDKTIYVNGSLQSHPSAKEIFAFLQKRGIILKERSIPIPIDVGSVLPLLIE